MNLEQELRAVLSQEAEMTNVTRPDVDGLISGGQDRRRRRNISWAGGVAAAVVLVGGGIYGITQMDGGDDGDTKTATEPTETTGPASPSVPLYEDQDESNLAPGTYRVTFGYDLNGVGLAADVTFSGAGWDARSHPAVSDDNGVATIGVYEPVALAGGSGCSDDAVLTRTLGQTSEALASQLARLPHSEVVQAPAPAEVSGRDAVHLRLRVDPQCGAVAVYRPVETSTGPRGMTYTKAEQVLIVDFWVLEVEGVLFMVDMVRNPDTPQDLVDQAADAIESITFVPVE